MGTRHGRMPEVNVKPFSSVTERCGSTELAQVSRVLPPIHSPSGRSLLALWNCLWIWRPSARGSVTQGHYIVCSTSLGRLTNHIEECGRIQCQLKEFAWHILRSDELSARALLRIERRSKIGGSRMEHCRRRSEATIGVCDHSLSRSAQR